MSSFNMSEYISYILIHNENASSGKEPTPVKSTLLPGQARVIVVASLPTNPSRDVTLKIPIKGKNVKFLPSLSRAAKSFTPFIGVYIALLLINRGPYRWGLCPNTRFLMSGLKHLKLGRSRWVVVPGKFRQNHAAVAEKPICMSQL